MLNRRGFLRLLAGAVAGMFAGKVGAVEAGAQPEIGLAGTREHCNLQLQIHSQVCIKNVRVYGYALSDAEVMQRYLELISDNPLTEGLAAFWSGADLVLQTTESTIYWDESPSDGPDEPLHWCLPPLRKCWPMNDGRKGCA